MKDLEKWFDAVAGMIGTMVCFGFWDEYGDSRPADALGELFRLRIQVNL